jgi:hypothetical protein
VPNMFSMYASRRNPFSIYSRESIDAEGNGDSISAAVQAERIALLTSVLTQGMPNPQVLAPQSPNHPQLTRAHSLTPPRSLHTLVDLSPPKSNAQVHRSQSHFDLGTQYAYQRPIYQTSGQGQPCPSFPMATQVDALFLHAPAPLLPSFLQDIVQSPTPSPTSTSSAELSFDENEDGLPSPIGSTVQRRNRHSNVSDSSSTAAIGNIWKLDGDETKTLSAFALPNHEDLVGGIKRSSREMLLSRRNTP